MAKNDNLKDFLIDVADAIRAKKGTSDAINPQDFSAEIASIETEVGMVSKDVNFYDYDGTLLYSYTWDEVVALTELPPLPSQEGLICQKWNYTLDDIKTQSHHMADVGAVYTTDDDSTRLYLNFKDHYNTDIVLNLSISSGNVPVVVYWGDGETHTIHDTGNISIPHTYGKAGNFVIKIEGKFYFGHGTEAYHALGTIIAKRALWKIERGTNAYAEDYAFKAYVGLKYLVGAFPGHEVLRGCTSLKCLIFTASNGSYYSYADLSGLKVLSLPPKWGGVAWDGVFNNLTSLERLVIPQGCTNVSHYSTFLQAGVKKIALPNSLRVVGSNTFMNCKNLSEVRILSSLLNGNSTFGSCQNLERVNIENGVETLCKETFKNCTALSHIYFPPSFSQIPEKLLGDCVLLKEVSFIDHASIPVLSNKNAFTGVNKDCKIIVPTPLYEEWKIATNWASIEDMIISDYIAEECLSLEITADDVIGNKTSTIIRWKAVTNGRDSHGNIYKNWEVTGKAESPAFPQNTSETDVVSRSVDFTYLGVTASAQFTQKQYVNYRIECVYDATSTTSNTTLVNSYKWGLWKTYINKITVDGEEVAVSDTYKFTTVGEHIVVIDFNDDVNITTMYEFFKGATALKEAKVYLDLGNLTEGATSQTATAYMFYGCSNLKYVSFERELNVLYGYTFYGCTNLETLIFKGNKAPNTVDSCFGTYSSTAGYNTRANGTNKLYIPKDAIGYDSTHWTQYLLNPSYGGFSIVEIEE